MKHPSGRHRLTASLALFATTAALLTGCGKSDATAATPAAAPTVVPVAAAPKPASGEAAVNQKFNTYTEGYNKLIGTFGLPQTQARYLEENIPARKATENFSITDGWVSLANDLLKKGRAIKASGLEDLDKGADQLIASLDALVPKLAELMIYYDGKAYKDDNLAKGKAADASVRSAFSQSTADMERFNDLLTKEERKRTDLMLAKLKAAGDLLNYHTKLALQQASDLMALFESPADIKNPAKYQSGDALVAQLEKTLAEQRTAYAAAKSKNPRIDSDYETVSESLVSLTGEYRSMKQSKSASYYKEMVDEYNRAVEGANGID